MNLRGTARLLLGVTAAAALLAFQQAQVRPASSISSAKAQKQNSVSGPTAQNARKVLDQYCVTCHNDKTKTANFSLEKADLATAGDHPEIWERVIRKMRAGMMPPAGLPRPPLADLRRTARLAGSRNRSQSGAHTRTRARSSCIG